MQIRRFVFLILAISVMLVFSAAYAEVELELSMDCVPLENVLDFTVTGAAADSYRYTLFHEGKELFVTESELGFGSYLPRQKGKYTLKVTMDDKGKESSATAEFTVVDKLTLTSAGFPDEIHVGGTAELNLQADGGTPPYRFVYAVTDETNVITEQQGGEHWYWAPMREGDYFLHAAVIDSKGASAVMRNPLRVNPFEGIGLVHNGGALIRHGGQKSWMVCSTEEWTAETSADFLRVDTPSGQPGDSLVITALSETSVPRSGVVLITSGGSQLEWTVTQSAQYGVDEEVYLFPKEEKLQIDQQKHVLWTEAENSRSFAVSSDGESVSAETDSDFITVEISSEKLTVTVEESSSAAVRSGLVTVSSPAGNAYVYVFQSPGHEMETDTVNSGIRWETMNLYSQFSGLWKEAKYDTSTLEHSGCAIFALSHALQWLGYEGRNIEPAELAEKYAFCLRDGGTINSTLVGNAGDDFGYKTRFDLYTEKGTILKRLEQGAVFSFAVVEGHIALVVEKSEDGSMMRIIDSAPSATWERIKGAQLYRRDETGAFVPVKSLTELEGIRYYIENNAFGGATYWLEDRYVVRRGVRLIQPRDE